MVGLRTFMALGALVIAAGCQPEPEAVTSEDGFTIRDLPNCGTERVGEFSLYRESPVTNEGNGYVGFATEEQNATGVNKQRYSLVNCSTRSLVRVEADLPTAGAADVEISLFERVDQLRNRSRLANEDLFATAAREAGYSVTVGVLPPIGDDRATRADCGCRRFYWDTVRRDDESPVLVNR